MKYKAEFRIVGTSTYFTLPVENHNGEKEETHRDLAVWGLGRSLDLVALEEVPDEN